MPATWDIEQHDDPAAYDMIREIYLRLAEYTRGDRTEGELKAAMWPLVAAERQPVLTAEPS